MAKHWLDRAEYPFTSHYTNINGCRLHFIDEGRGDVILFVHGTPSWSFDYRNIIKNLRSNYRCIAVDHIGFGLSDKPDRYDYSTQNHSKTLEKFILEQQLTDITLVVHDFGGPIGLNFAIKYPEKIKNIVILNSWLWSSKTDPDFIKFSKILKNPLLRRLLRFLYLYLNFSPNYILPKSFGNKKITRKTLAHYTKPFADSTQRRGVWAFAESLLNDQDWFEALWNKRHSIADKSTVLIWGMKDPIIKPKNLDRFTVGWVHAKVVKLKTSGHFPQEEDPGSVTESLIDFLTATKNHH